MRIVQLAPEIRPGSGVEGVAHQLEQALAATGAEVERFTLADSGGGWLRLPEGGVPRHLAVALRVVWFSTVGTVRARRFLAARPDAVAICHNDVLAGDVYVNHGILRAAMRARGHYAWRMARNPLHLFTSARDALRYRSGVHRVVVCLTDGERDLLRETYPRLRPRSVVIPNGVDTERFRLPSAAERATARAAIRAVDGDMVAVFVGHEFDRKGLDIALRALREADGVLLIVVGGSPEMVAGAEARAHALGVADRVRFVGRQADPAPFLHAGDVFVLPSAYEANALVVLEALACGLPVLSTRVGFAPDIIADGENGFLIERDPSELARRLGDLAAGGEQWRARARATAERFAWDAVARRYLALAGEIAREKGIDR